MKAAVIVLSDPTSESEESLGRVFNALAAAYAETGRYEEAARTAENALAVAKGVSAGLAAEIEVRLKLYRAGQPYRADARR